MQMFRRFLGASLAVLLAAPTAFAQQTPHVISPSALDQAVQQRVSQDQADREAVRYISAESSGERRRGEGRAVNRQG